MCRLLGWRHAWRCPTLVGILDMAFSRGPKDWLSPLVGTDILLIHTPFSFFFSFETSCALCF